PHFAECNFAELENQYAEILHRRAPRSPSPPFVRPVTLLVSRNAGCRPESCTHLRGRFVQPCAQRKFRDRLAQLTQQVQRILAPGKHLPDRKPQFRRLVPRNHMRQATVLGCKRLQLRRLGQEEDAERTVEKSGQIFSLAQRGLTLARLPSLQLFRLHVEAFGRPEHIVTALLARPREQSRIDRKGGSAWHTCIMP